MDTPFNRAAWEIRAFVSLTRPTAGYKQLKPCLVYPENLDPMLLVGIVIELLVLPVFHICREVGQMPLFLTHCLPCQCSLPLGRYKRQQHFGTFAHSPELLEAYKTRQKGLKPSVEWNSIWHLESILSNTCINKPSCLPLY